MVFTTELNEDTEKSLNLEEEQVPLKEIVNSTVTLCLMKWHFDEGRWFNPDYQDLPCETLCTLW